VTGQEIPNGQESSNTTSPYVTGQKSPNVTGQKSANVTGQKSANVTRAGEPERDGTGESMTDEVRAAAQRMYAAFNAYDHAAAQEIFTADFYSHPMGTTGPESVTRSWQRFHEAFPDAQVVVEDMIVEGDTAAVRTSVHGTSGPQPPTMLEIFRVRDGRIAELWGLSSLRRDPEARGSEIGDS
jgi:predicted SnoaL-like aldol condensation-catalyzing enzyme